MMQTLPRTGSKLELELGQSLGNDVVTVKLKECKTVTNLTFHNLLGCCKYSLLFQLKKNCLHNLHKYGPSDAFNTVLNCEIT